MTFRCLRELGLSVAITALALFLCAPAAAVLPSEKLADPVLEARALALSKELRCVICQNQSIDDSAAPIAADMRLLLRERIAAGASDEEAVAYLVDRYGNFVLLKPPFQPDTWFLWLSPFAIFVIATVAMLAQLRRGAMRRRMPPGSAAAHERSPLPLQTTQ